MALPLAGIIAWTAGLLDLLSLVTELLALAGNLLRMIMGGVTTNDLKPGASAEAEFAAHERWAKIQALAEKTGLGKPPQVKGS